MGADHGPEAAIENVQGPQGAVVRIQDEQALVEDGEAGRATQASGLIQGRVAFGPILKAGLLPLAEDGEERTRGGEEAHRMAIAQAEAPPLV